MMAITAQYATLALVNAEDRFRYLLLLGFVVLMSIGVLHRFRARTGEPLDRSQEGWFVFIALRFSALIGFAGVAAYLIQPASMRFSAVPLPFWLRWVGVALGVLTVLLLFWTLRTLGKNLTDTVVTRKQHTLVTSGPYRWVRHPFYVCAALITVVTSLVSANVFVLVPGGVILLLLALRTRVEERNLLSRFGEAYRTYMKRTGRFFPRL